MFIKLQNKGENTKLMIKNLQEKFFCLFFSFFLFFRVGPAWGAAARPPSPLDPPLALGILGLFF